jgi:hypothetical protein
LEKSDDNKPEVAGAVASIALLVFFGAHVFFLSTWFSLASASASLGGTSLFNWKMILTLVTAVIALVLSATLWRNPTRIQAVLGLLAMASSLVRVGFPNQWTGYSFAIFALTAALSIPLVHAAIGLKR